MPRTIICTDLDGQTYPVDADALTFRPAVYALIIKTGQVLLTRQWDGYCFPGGGIELGETIEEAVIREAREETGLVVKPVRVIDCATSFFKIPSSSIFVHSLLVFYTCEVIGGKLSSDLLDEGERISMQPPTWVDLETAYGLKFMSTYDSVSVLKMAASTPFLTINQTTKR